MIDCRIVKAIIGNSWDYFKKSHLETTKDVNEILFEVTRKSVYLQMKTKLFHLRYKIGEPNEGLLRGFYLITTSRDGFGKISKSAVIDKLWELSNQKAKLVWKEGFLSIGRVKFGAKLLNSYVMESHKWFPVEFKGDIFSLKQLVRMYKADPISKEFYQRIHFDAGKGTSVTDGKTILLINRFTVSQDVDLPLVIAGLIGLLGHPGEIFINENGDSNWLFRDATLICSPYGKYPNVSNVIPDHRKEEYKLITELEANDIPLGKLESMIKDTANDSLKYMAAWIIKNQYGIRLGAKEGGDFINIPCNTGENFCACLYMEDFLKFIETEHGRRLKLYGIPGSKPTEENFLFEGQGVRWVHGPRVAK